MLEAKLLTFQWKHWNIGTSIAVLRHHVPFHIIFSTKGLIWQTEQNQLMSTPQEQNVDWERGRMLRIYIGFQATKFYCFPPLKPPLPPPSHFYCFSSSSSSFLLFFLLLLLISIVFPPPPPHSIVFYPSPTRFIFFSPRDSIKDCQLPSLVHFEAMSRVVNKNRGFLQLLADCPAYQCQFL